MPARYRWNADKGEEIPPETDEERQAREADELRVLRLKEEEEERERRSTGPYL